MLYDAAEACRKELLSNGGRRMPEAITYEYIIGFWVFLVDAFAESVFTELLFSINAEIDGRTNWVCGRSGTQPYAIPLGGLPASP